MIKYKIKNSFLLILVLSIYFSTSVYAQNIVVYGKVTSSKSTYVEDVMVQVGTYRTISDEEGKYELHLPEKKIYTLTFIHIGYYNFNTKVANVGQDSVEVNVQLEEKKTKIKEVEVFAKSNGISEVNRINVYASNVISSAGDGVTSILKTLPGVISNNELSSKYMVRGGSFDENLIYINGIEIYKPFLVRTGQQEGLTFVNSNMVSNIAFYTGGFESKFGDKMSSVLDISYREPQENRYAFEASLLGASATVDLISENKKWSSITGFRYKNIGLITGTRETEVDIKPIYTDIQSIIKFKPNDKLKINFLTNLSVNRYNYRPLSRVTNFGTVEKPIQVNVFFTGEEKNIYTSIFGSANAEYSINKRTKTNMYLATYYSSENEYFDILSKYSLSELDNNPYSDDFGKPAGLIGSGSQLKHGRNEFNSSIIDVGTYTTHIFRHNIFKWGVKYKKEIIFDIFDEWDYIDSSGYSLPHHSNEPYEAYEDSLKLYNSTYARNNLISNRGELFTQYEYTAIVKNVKISYNIGLRFNYWDVNNQLVISPRTRFEFQEVNNTNILYWISAGKYSQVPFYRELRDFSGKLNKDVKAQDSWHFVLGTSYDFVSNNRPFKVTGEFYYKYINNLNPYIIDNVNIRYFGNNNATGKITGADFRVNGEFVLGIESWISVGVMKAVQNINNQGVISLPSDQRFNLAMFFQDYFPKFPTYKVNLHIIYSSGLPSGTPSHEDIYNYQFNMPSYKRLDLGFTKVFSDNVNDIKSKLFPKVDYSAISLEILNILDIKNTVSYSWIRDTNTKVSYAVPNRLTGVFINVKLQVRF